ncbi:hypothetical protein BGX24_007857 [Mortierella sp. AD032]|nr:hypothetical protein BGX24_007857 [Mortierella sp. AD032]
MDRDVVMDRDQQQQQLPSSLAQHPQGDTHTQAHQHHQGHTHTHQARRIPGPEFFAQLMMSLHESAATANRTTPSTSSSTPTAAASEDAMGVTPVENGQQGRGSLTGTVEGPTPATPSGRTRLRSSSMRGLFGYQPTNELTGEERPAAADSVEAGVTAGTTGTDAETGTPRGDRNAERFALQIPFFLRLLAEISRMPQGSPDEAGADQTEDATATDRPVEATVAATTTEGASQQAHPSNPATTTTAPGTGPSAEPSSENGAPRLRRPNTTIRLIQFGHGVRHPRPSGAPTAPTGTSGPTGATGATTPTGDVQGETEGGEGEAAGPPSEGVNETFIMFLSGPPPEDDTDSSDPAAPGSDDPESARNRARHRAPWVVLTLSGAYLNSMMQAGPDGEGGSTYDDLWMLANLIGPARPITTTQEAIDNAGFAVGRFEQALQGMRNVATLGDGSKCLVCMSEYEEGEDMRALKCHHGFHQECIDKWLTTGANKCPVCRAAAVVTESPMAVEPEVSVNPSEQ